MKRLLQLSKSLIDLYNSLLLDNMKKFQAPKTKYQTNSNNQNSKFEAVEFVAGQRINLSVFLTNTTITI
jgi:hypothetical protein